MGRERCLQNIATRHCLIRDRLRGVNCQERFIRSLPERGL